MFKASDDDREIVDCFLISEKLRNHIIDSLTRIKKYDLSSLFELGAKVLHGPCIIVP